MSDASTEISTILGAKNLKSLFASDSVEDVKTKFRHLAKLIHPDKCSDSRASEAFLKLYEW